MILNVSKRLQEKQDSNKVIRKKHTKQKMKKGDICGYREEYTCRWSVDHRQAFKFNSTRDQLCISYLTLRTIYYIRCCIWRKLRTGTNKTQFSRFYTNVSDNKGEMEYGREQWKLTQMFIMIFKTLVKCNVMKVIKYISFMMLF